jgi:hypothetical protein
VGLWGGGCKVFKVLLRSLTAGRIVGERAGRWSIHLKGRPVNRSCAWDASLLQPAVLSCLGRASRIIRDWSPAAMLEKASNKSNVDQESSRRSVAAYYLQLMRFNCSIPHVRLSPPIHSTAPGRAVCRRPSQAIPASTRVRHCGRVKSVQHGDDSSHFTLTLSGLERIL